ncbi:hypothetical protein HBP54_12305 [Listeria welshimeri]|nr:hypothetical protein [Listeria welshimeri]MBC1461003.1 hypothetical protein [Listeria welshimeri]MBC1655985.1 hypothetical protein [Listeria welshimeri]MBC1666867.1 hypothetical protein [Listeria welshimeri]MBC1950698.1 hypothetical protein [Listeria welshimeri]
MSKKLVSIILLLVGYGKENIDSKYSWKWDLEQSDIGVSELLYRIRSTRRFLEFINIEMSKKHL